MSSISGARGPRLASAGGVGPRLNVARAAAAMPPAAIAPSAATISRRRRRMRDGRPWGDDFESERRGRGTTRGPTGRRREEGLASLLPEPSTHAHYQSNFTPNRQRRGGMIVVGSRNVEPEPQLMFCPAFALLRL